MRGWAFHPQKLDDELLSSYLLRSARLHASLPHTFCAIHMPEFPVWYRDVDRSPSAALIKRIAFLSKFSEAEIEQMTFRSLWHVFGEKSGIIPWVRPLGIWHRKRTAFGLQYCPACLQNRPQYFRRSWRLAFMTFCPDHRIRLLDKCTQCDSPIAAHRAIENRIFNCNICGKDLSQVGTRNLRTGSQGWLSMLLLRAFRGELITFSGQTILPSDWLVGCRILMMLAICRFLGFQGQVFEQSEALQRETALAVLEDWLSKWPEGFLDKCHEVGVTRQTFVRYNNMPAWLAAQVGSLAPGNSRIRLPEESSLDLKLIRHSGPEWRHIRAAAILNRIDGA